MKSTIVLITMAALSLGVAGSAFAGCRRTPAISGAQVRQQGRIAQGLRSGELTRGEARRLERQERAIERAKVSCRADGCVTPAERHAIRTDQRRASGDIYRAKHNGRVR